CHVDGLTEGPQLGAGQFSSECAGSAAAGRSSATTAPAATCAPATRPAAAKATAAKATTSHAAAILSATILPQLSKGGRVEREHQPAGDNHEAAAGNCQSETGAEHVSDPRTATDSPQFTTLTSAGVMRGSVFCRIPHRPAG